MALDRSRFVIAQVLDIDTGEPTGSHVLLERVSTCDGPRTRVSCEPRASFAEMQARVKEHS